MGGNRALDRSTGDVPPLVTQIKGYVLPSGLSPARILRACLAWGKTCCPCLSTPSMSKVKAGVCFVAARKETRSASSAVALASPPGLDLLRWRDTRRALVLARLSSPKRRNDAPCCERGRERRGAEAARRAQDGPACKSPGMEFYCASESSGSGRVRRGRRRRNEERQATFALESRSRCGSDALGCLLELERLHYSPLPPSVDPRDAAVTSHQPSSARRRFPHVGSTSTTSQGDGAWTRTTCARGARV